jgi:hypothetical protein
MSDTAVVDLYQDYCAYFKQTGFYQIQPYIHLPTYEGMCKHLSVYRQWALDTGVDPKWYLFVQFELNRWAYPPKRTQLRSKARLDRYYQSKTSGNRDLYVRLQTEMGKRQRPELDRGRQIQPVVENRKYLVSKHEGPGACYARMHTDTHGYHPASKVCAQCPLAQACASALAQSKRFDVLGLRAGSITEHQARHQEAGGWDV